jgi:hypothetical protein
MYGCQNWQCSAGDSPESIAKKYKKTTYEKIKKKDGVQVENDPTGWKVVHVQNIVENFYSCINKYTQVWYMYVYTTITTISYTHSHNTLTTLTTQLQLLSHLASQSSYCPTVFMNSTTQCSTTVVSPQLIDAFVYLDYMYFTTVPCDCRCSLVLV